MKIAYRCFGNYESFLILCLPVTLSFLQQGYKLRGLGIFE